MVDYLRIVRFVDSKFIKEISFDRAVLFFKAAQIRKDFCIIMYDSIVLTYLMKYFHKCVVLWAVDLILRTINTHILLFHVRE